MILFSVIGFAVSAGLWVWYVFFHKKYPAPILTQEPEEKKIVCEPCEESYCIDEFVSVFGTSFGGIECLQCPRYQHTRIHVVPAHWPTPILVHGIKVGEKYV